MSKQEITLYTLKKEVKAELDPRFTEKIINTVINHMIDVFSGKKQFQINDSNNKIQYCFPPDFKELTLAACHIHLSEDKNKYLLRCRGVTSIKTINSNEKPKYKTKERYVSYSDMECFFLCLIRTSRLLQFFKGFNPKNRKCFEAGTDN